MIQLYSSISNVQIFVALHHTILIFEKLGISLFIHLFFNSALVKLFATLETY